MRRLTNPRPALHVVAWLLLATYTILPPRVAAQGHLLHVSIRDAGDQALAGLTVIVRSEDGQELARQSSDREGMASFADLPAVVRVAVEGQARGGPRLYQLGDDALGVRLDLGLAHDLERLDLRVEHDGLVLPDPATMIAREAGGSSSDTAQPMPTAVLATPVLATPALRLTAPTGAHASEVRVDPAQDAEQQPGDGWVAPVTLLIVVGAACVLRLVQQLRSTR